jgi:hypothetical protein
VSGVPPAPAGAPRRFAPRRIAFDQGADLVRESYALLAASPWRLSGMFLLVFVPLQLLPNFPYVAMPLRVALASIGYAGFFAALESVRQGRPATLLDMALPWRLRPDKLVLLVAAGLVPLLVVLIVWALDVGAGQFDALLSRQGPDAVLAPRQQIEYILVSDLLGVPLLFLQPLCVLHAWSATRTLSATLILALVNRHWVLALTAVEIAVDVALVAFEPTSAAEDIVSLLTDLAVYMVLSAFTLVLMQRSLR